MSCGHNRYELIAPDVHNPLIKLPTFIQRFMSLAYVQSLALSMLIFPVRLSHEHNALKAILTPWDYRNLFTLCVWWSVFLLVRTAIKSRVSLHKVGNQRAISKRDRIFYCLGFILVSYLPASHVSYAFVVSQLLKNIHYLSEWTKQLLLKVGFVLAERTLFIPTMASVILVPDIIKECSDAFSNYLVDSSWALNVTLEETRIEIKQEHLNDACTENGLTETQPVVQPSHASTVRFAEAPVAQVKQRKTKPPAPKLELRKAAYGKEEQNLVREQISGLVFRLILFTIFAYFFVRTWVRNNEWYNEEELLLSSLRTYPEDNFMSMYGLG